MNDLNLIGRNKELFSDDISVHNRDISNIIENSSFLVLGAAGSIGQALAKEILLYLLLNANFSNFGAIIVQ